MAPPRKTVRQYEREARRVGRCLVHPAWRVARKVYQMRHGPLKTAQYVCHTCDNPQCIRDSHHFIGTCGDNVRDAVRKGRHSCFRKGGARFAGTHTRAVRKRIAAASRSMWDEPGRKALMSKAMSIAQQKMTPEQHRERLRKAWETRRGKKN